MSLQEQFDEWCTEHSQSLPYEVKSIPGVVAQTIRRNKSHYDTTVARNAFVSDSWTVGGQTGGSCWAEGEQHHYAVSGEAEVEFTELNDFLEHYYPTLSFLDYRKLLKLIDYHEFGGGGDYYGNYTNYMVKFLLLADLEKVLLDASLISD